MMNSEDLQIVFSDTPGCRERHLIRKYNNPLFGRTNYITQEVVNQARADDLKDTDEFQSEFHSLVQEASELESSVDTEQVLGLKEKIDRLYDRCVNLGTPLSKHKQALIKLNDSIMRTIRHAAGDDSMAIRELDREAKARELHLQLVEYKLVSDLLREDSPIEENELVPTLLSEDPEAVQIVMSLFDPDQQEAIRKEAGAIVASLRSRDDVPAPTLNAYQAMNQQKQ